MKIANTNGCGMVCVSIFSMVLVFSVWDLYINYANAKNKI